MLRLVTWAAGALVCREAYLAFGPRRVMRRQLWSRAVQKARETGRPLLVVGDPDTGFVTRHFGRDYGCGDVCTDLTGCPRCPVGVRGPLEEVLPQLASGSHVVYVACTLEYVTDLPHCVRQLERIAVPGGLFVSRVEPGSLTSLFYPGGNWVLDSAPPGGGFRYRSVRSRALPAASR